MLLYKEHDLHQLSSRIRCCISTGGSFVTFRSRYRNDLIWAAQANWAIIPLSFSYTLCCLSLLCSANLCDSSSQWTSYTDRHIYVYDIQQTYDILRSSWFFMCVNWVTMWDMILMYVQLSSKNDSQNYCSHTKALHTCRLKCIHRIVNQILFLEGFLIYCVFFFVKRFLGGRNFNENFLGVMGNLRIVDKAGIFSYITYYSDNLEFEPFIGLFFFCQSVTNNSFFLSLTLFFFSFLFLSIFITFAAFSHPSARSPHSIYLFPSISPLLHYRHLFLSLLAFWWGWARFSFNIHVRVSRKMYSFIWVGDTLWGHSRRPNMEREQCILAKIADSLSQIRISFKVMEDFTERIDSYL